MTRDEAGISTIELAAPPFNAFDTAIRRALGGFADTVGEDGTTTRVVVLIGERAFAAGADISAVAAKDYETVIGWNCLLQRTFTPAAELAVCRSPPRPTATPWVGMEPAMAAEYRVASASALIGQPKLLGILPGSGGAQRLTRPVGPSRAKKRLMTARPGSVPRRSPPTPAPRRSRCPPAT